MEIKAQDLEKTFGDTFRLGPVNINIASGKVAGVFGKNGSGKSTLIQLLTGNLDATKGTVHMGGSRMLPQNSALRAQVGFLPQASQLPAWQSAAELLDYAARLQNIAAKNEKISREMQRWGVAEFAHRAVSQCSGGMQKRIGLALISLLDAPVTVLDEPFTGLDVWYCQQLFLWLEERKKNAKTTLVCTHHLSYLARLADIGIFVEAGKAQILDHIDNNNWQKQTAQLEAMIL